MPGTRQLDQSAPSVALDRERVPNLDVGALFGGGEAERVALVREIRAACHDPGFFCVHNTCVDGRTIERALAAARVFFELPDDGAAKQSVHNRLADGMKGWGPLFSEPAYQAGTVAHVESFDIGQQLSAAQYASLGITPNIWPRLPEFRAAVLGYYAAVTRLGRAIAEVLSELLGQERGFINRHSGITAPRTMRLLHYPANEGPADACQVGISAHTDFECFTIMHQTAPGLELTDTSGRWCEAAADIGSFTVILGDMTERFSNGHFKATGHRVVDTPWERYSLILFFAVDGGCEVAPLPAFVSEDNPARYEPVTQDRHIEAELQAAAGHG